MVDIVDGLDGEALAGSGVALLSETSSGLVQLREAVESLGLVSMYESTTDAFDSDALARSQATVVVVNLDAPDGEGTDLDALYDRLDTERYHVVFNDGDGSGGLSGWDHARWLRHLAAKIAGGNAGLYPPRPADALAVPEPVAQMFARVEQPSDSVESDSGAEHDAADEDAYLAATAHAQEILRESSESVADDLSSSSLEIDLGGLELIDFAEMPDPPQLGADAIGSDLRLDAGDEFNLDDFDAPSAVDLGAVAGDEMILEDSLFEAESLDTDAALAQDADAVAAAILSDEAAPLKMSAPDWTLEEIVESPAPSSVAPVAARDFGIETIRPADFLAPADDSKSPPIAETSIFSTLELIPLEEAVVPTPIEHEGRESWLESAFVAPTVQVRRVWVLGASIGGPESVREFLAGLPSGYPALFVLAQHLGDEFVDMMASQLAKATALTVRTPQHGERVGHGEVVIVPAAKRLRIDAAGVVVLERAVDGNAQSASIDGVMRDFADAFGAETSAIIFSGMGDDAVEGCRYLVEKGGTVYAQHPDTCVVSTMVDAACEAGLVEFLGSPQELAEKLRDAVA